MLAAFLTGEGGFFMSMLRRRRRLLIKCIRMAVCVISACELNNRLFGVWTMLTFGVSGFLMKKAPLPTIPLLLGFILGPIIEVNLRRGLMMSRGDFTSFVTETMSAALLALAVTLAAYPLY